MKTATIAITIFLAIIIRVNAGTVDFNASTAHMADFDISTLTPEQINAFAAIKSKVPIENIDTVLKQIHPILPNGIIAGSTQIDFSRITKRMTPVQVIYLMGEPDRSTIESGHGFIAYLLLPHDSLGLSEWMNILITNNIVTAVSYPVIKDSEHVPPGGRGEAPRP